MVLSFQAAYAAPIIMMSQNRQSEIDRRHAEHDYRINVKAELEIELLHNKIDSLREQEILKLLNIIQRLSAHLAPSFSRLSRPRRCRIRPRRALPTKGPDSAGGNKESPFAGALGQKAPWRAF